MLLGIPGAATVLADDKPSAGGNGVEGATDGPCEGLVGKADVEEGEALGGGVRGSKGAVEVVAVKGAVDVCAGGGAIGRLANSAAVVGVGGVAVNAVEVEGVVPPSVVLTSWAL